jgi:hypothetical protein
MRCRVPSSSAKDEIVPKQNMDSGRRMILCWKVTAIELAWINDTPPTWRASCWCFGSDRAPRVVPQGALWSRKVSLTVARWFVPDARETVDDLIQVRATWRCVIPYILEWIFYVVDYKRILQYKEYQKSSEWLKGEICPLKGCSVGLIYSTVELYMWI